MKLPAAVKAERDRYVAKFSVPHIPPNTPDTIDDALRAWTVPLCQQIRFLTKDPNWGAKRADPGRPISKDSIAFLEGPVLHMFDLLTSGSSGQGTINADPESLDVPIYPLAGGQTFVPVDPKDSIGTTPAPPPPVQGREALADWLAFGRHLSGVIYKTELLREFSDADAALNWAWHWYKEGWTDEQIIAAIRTSDEWKQKHPGK